MNNFKLEIYDYEEKKYIEYPTAIFPLKISELLDERLDEAQVFLKRIDREYFEPFTDVKITIINKPISKYNSLNKISERADRNDVTIEYDENTKLITETMVVNFLIANDKSVESPIGSGKYNHELYLIEITKKLESYIGDSISFTNPIGNDYVNESTRVPVVFFANNNRENIQSNYYKTPSFGNENFTFLSPSNFLKDNNLTLAQNGPQSITISDYSTSLVVYQAKIYYYNASDGGPSANIGWWLEEIYNGETYKEKLPSSSNGGYNYEIQNKTLYVPSGSVYSIVYKGTIAGTNALLDSEGVIFFLSNKLPLKKWTILDVVNRIVDTLVPLRYGQKPKFRLQGVIYDDTTGIATGYEQGSIAEKLDKILAPEFSFTKMNLKEMLKLVGGYIHAEPRIIAINYENGKKWYEFSFDKFGSKEYSNIKNHKHVTATLGTDINEYCTHLDSSAENLISQLDYAQGVVVEPFDGGGKSLRAESAAIRLAENDVAFISTDEPIYSIGTRSQVFCTYIPSVGYGKWDITPYIFEEADYQNLSSYKGDFPFSKAYALYYTQCTKNIKGLFFKNDHAISKVFENYAIKNILKSVTGQKLDGLNGSNYYELQFNVSYLPIFSTRIKTVKPNILIGEQSTIPYNQSANLIETRFYGEQLKGVVARLGNVEKTYTYNLAFLSDIPKVGTKFDEHYYISAVSSEILPFYIKCTISLSKDFNKLSEYVGISSNKRMWEVSEKQSQSRETTLIEYVVLSDNQQSFDNNSSYSSGRSIVYDIFNENADISPISNVVVVRKDKNQNNLSPQKISLPVISTSFGNSMLFAFNFQDNYSAGQKIIKETNDFENLTGFWTEYVSYSDYYGRFYYLQFDLMAGKQDFEDGNANSLPQGSTKNGNIISNSYLRYRKDNREIPSISYQLSAVTDSNLIIGSALMKNSKLVNANPRNYQLWVLSEDINSIDGFIDFDNATKVDEEIIFNESSITLPQIDIPHKSWAIVTDKIQQEMKVEDENGEVIEQIVSYGGELVLGANDTLENGRTIYFSVKSDIYD